MNGRMTRIAHAVERCLAGKTDSWSLCDRRSGIFYAVQRREDGVVKVIYRGTTVATIDGPSMWLRTGGWRSDTTKNVINAALCGAGSHVQVFQHKRVWYVTPLLEFSEDMEVIR